MSHLKLGLCSEISLNCLEEQLKSLNATPPVTPSKIEPFSPGSGTRYSASFPRGIHPYPLAYDAVGHAAAVASAVMASQPPAAENEETTEQDDSEKALSQIWLERAAQGAEAAGGAHV